MGRHVAGILGQKFGRLTVRSQTSNWSKCDCDCGVTGVFARTDKLKAGKRVSCGCINRERNAAQHKAAHPPRPPGRPKKELGIEVVRMKSVWHAMMQRCYNPRNKDYERYGAGGIAVCEEWHNRDVFLFQMSGSYRAGLWLERMDNSAGYNEANCSWETPYRQSLNRRNTLWLDCGSRRIALARWVRLHRLSYDRVYMAYTRLQKGGAVTEKDLLTALPKAI